MSHAINRMYTATIKLKIDRPADYLGNTKSSIPISAGIESILDFQHHWGSRCEKHKQSRNKIKLYVTSRYTFLAPVSRVGVTTQSLHITSPILYYIEPPEPELSSTFIIHYRPSFPGDVGDELRVRRQNLFGNQPITRPHSDSWVVYSLRKSPM